MKLKLIAALAATLGTTGAFAACPTVATDVDTLDELVNHCAPEVTFFMGGATAQAGAIDSVMTGTSEIFDLSKPRAKVYLTDAGVTGLNGGTDRTRSNSVGYIGFGAAGKPHAGKRVLVIYAKANGSAAGVYQVLTGKGSLAGEDVTLKTVSAAEQKAGTAGTCTINLDSTAGSLGDVSCPSMVSFNTAWGLDKQKTMHLAFSDVYPDELSPGLIKKWDRVKFPATRTAMQGFGVIVNPALYTALINKNITEGKLDASCASSEVVGGTTDAISFACQPTISRADYSALISDATMTAAKLLNNAADTTKLVLARRVDSSGTQASSNIFFAGQAAYNAKVKAPAVDGFLTLLNTTDTKAGVFAANAGFDVEVKNGTSDVITSVSNTADYRIGVVSLENTYALAKASSKLKGALFVKIDGQSPNMSTAGLDSKHRKGMQNGYGFAFEMSTVAPAKLATDAKLASHKAIADAVTAGLQDPAYNLSGIAYINSADTAKNTTYTHGGVNNLPMVKN